MATTTQLQITELLPQQSFRFFANGQTYTVYDVHEEFITYYRSGETELQNYWHFNEKREVFVDQLEIMW